MMAKVPLVYKETCLIGTRLKDSAREQFDFHQSPSNLEVSQRVTVPEEVRSAADGGSCSGLMIDSKNGLVLTHCSLFLPLLDKLGIMPHSGQPMFEAACSRLSCSVLLEVEDKPRKQDAIDRLLSGEILQPYFTALMNIATNTPKMHHSNSSRSTVKRTQSHKAEIKHVFKVDKFADTLMKLMPHTDGWRLVDENLDGQEAMSSLSQKSEIVHDVLSYFVLIQLLEWHPVSQRHPRVYPSSRVQLGDPVYAVSTPFGMLSPPVFLNSVSKGVLCNAAGPDNCMLLTDARCIPGGEGGGIYVATSHNRLSLVGMVVASMCWKANEWMGLTIACSMSEILKALVSNTKYTLQQQILGTEEHYIHRLQKSPVPVVCLVDCAGSWGSGVLIDPSQGLILSCSHVVNFSSHHKAVYIYGLSDHAVRAEVLFCSPEKHVYDIAVLKVQPTAQLRAMKRPRVAYPTEGEVVRVLGHGGGFSAGRHMNPSISQGVVSRVLQIRASPALIQSTCAVHRGTSGGALINQDGAVVGIVVCNTRDTATGASYPHINFSIPLWTIWPILQEYKETQDKVVLYRLVTAEPDIIAAWSLKLADVTSVSSKL